jgi:hypothetical protein
VTVANVLRSGVLLRGSYGINGSQYVNVHYYGAGLQRNLFNMVDIMVRYDRQEQKIGASNINYNNNSFSTDLLLMFGRSWYLSLTHTYTKSLNLKYNSLYSEVSWRF